MRQPLCGFKSIHIIVDGHKIKMSILLATQGFNFTNWSFHSLHFIEKWSLHSVVAPTESAQSKHWAESWQLPAVTQENSDMEEDEEASFSSRDRSRVWQLDVFQTPTTSKWSLEPVELYVFISYIWWKQFKHWNKRTSL